MVPPERRDLDLDVIVPCDRRLARDDAAAELLDEGVVIPDQLGGFASGSALVVPEHIGQRRDPGVTSHRHGDDRLSALNDGGRRVAERVGPDDCLGG
jgi:hypothetical protein